MSGLTLTSMAEWVRRFFGEGDQDGVNLKNIVGLPAVWYCVGRASGCMTQMPLVLYRKLDRGAEKATDHPAYDVAKRHPSPFMMASDFQQLMTVHALLWGNARAAIMRNGTKPLEMIPLMPDRTRTWMIDGKIYHVTKPERDERVSLYVDMTNDPQGTVVLEDRNVFHLKGLGIDGVEGMSLVDVAKKTFGAEISAAKRTNSAMRKGFTSALLLEDGNNQFRDEEKAKDFLDKFRKSHSTDENAGVVGMLRSGMKANVVQMSNADAQFIEQRQFNRQEIALLFGVESMPGDNSSVSYNSLEHKNMTFLINALGPIKVKYEQQMEKLLTDAEVKTDKYFFRFNSGALLQTDMQTTVASLRSAVEATIISRNEAREMLDRNPVKGGDIYQNPNTTSPNAQPKPQPEPDHRDDHAASAVQSRLKQLIGVESNRVKSGAKAKDFLSWMDNFYARWQNTITEVVRELGGSVEMAAEHCEQSRELLLDCAGTAKSTDELIAAVSELVSGWGQRAESLANLIVKGK